MAHSMPIRAHSGFFRMGHTEATINSIVKNRHSEIGPKVAAHSPATPPTFYNIKRGKSEANEQTVELQSKWRKRAKRRNIQKEMECVYILGVCERTQIF